VRFGLRVDANGALLVNRETAVAVEDVGKAARLYLGACAEAVLMNRRTAALIVL